MSLGVMIKEEVLVLGVDFDVSLEFWVLKELVLNWGLKVL